MRKIDKLPKSVKLSEEVYNYVYSKGRARQTFDAILRQLLEIEEK